ncbi:MAG: diguanylate cyclase [Lachnospiraceae bacterium]|nr:diguanylate cyclase [Lachnospiraceae bacterium]
MRSKKRSKLSQSIQAVAILPVLLFSIIIAIFAARLFEKEMNIEAEEELSALCTNLSTMYDIKYPGDYRLDTGDGTKIYKGDTDITSDLSLVNAVAQSADCDATFFYSDTRIHTTFTDNKGKLIIGTGAAEDIIEKVYKAGETAFYRDIYLYGDSYYVYYMPIKNSDDEVVGMMSVAKSKERLSSVTNKTIIPLVAACFLLAAFVAFLIHLYFRGIIKVLETIRQFVTNISSGNLNLELDGSVTQRSDELGDIGRSIVNMQSSLRDIFEKDPLTKLDNRRSCYRKINNIINKAKVSEIPYSIAIGDIDFFKKVNDTYGHACGDEVLKVVAKKLQSHMKKIGCVARWGGEEFLLAFDHFCAEEAKESLEEFLEVIRGTVIKFDDLDIKVTMTFGITEGDSDDIVTLVREADEKLYYGKENGRTRVVL